MPECTPESTNRLIKVMIALLVRKEDDRVRSLKEQIAILSELGLRPVEIAETLGKSSTHVNKELSGLRKSGKTER